MSSKKQVTETIKYKYGEQDVAKLNRLRIAGRVVKWWYSAPYLYYEIKK